MLEKVKGRLKLTTLNIAHGFGLGLVDYLKLFFILLFVVSACLSAFVSVKKSILNSDPTTTIQIAFGYLRHVPADGIRILKEFLNTK